MSKEKYFPTYALNLSSQLLLRSNSKKFIYKNILFKDEVHMEILETRSCPRSGLDLSILLSTKAHSIS
jgi:hypothetical protein